MKVAVDGQNESNNGFQKEIRKEMSVVSTNVLRMKEEVYQLNEIHKHRDFEIRLTKRIKDQIVFMTNKGGAEREWMLMIADKMMVVIHHILDTDFECVKGSNLYEDLDVSINLITPLIDKKKNINGRAADIQTNLKSYVASIHFVAEQETNGERRKKFEDSTLGFINDLTKIILSL